MRVICLDTEYDARYTDVGVSRLACLSYSEGPGHAEVVGPGEAVQLWEQWAADPAVRLLGHSVYKDLGVLAQEHHRRTTGEEAVPGFGPSWELAHRLYDDERVIDTEIDQRLTHIRFGPHKASVALGALAQMYFGEDVSDAKAVPDEVRELLRAAVPYEEWPDDWLDRAPHRVKFGYYLERFGEDPSQWPSEAVDYARDDVRLPWMLHDWQRKRWGREIPDRVFQTRSAWVLHLISIPGWRSDRARVASIRRHYRDVVTHCDRTLVDAGILHAPGRKLTAKRGMLQGYIAAAYDGRPPLSPKTAKTLTAEQIDALTAVELRDQVQTSEAVVKKAIETAGGPLLHLDAALAPGADVVALCRSTAAPELNAHLLYVESRKLAASAKTEPHDAARYTALAEDLLPFLASAGIVEISEPRTIKKAKVAEYVFARLGEEAPLTKTAALEFPEPTLGQRRKHCATDSKAVRAAIISTGKIPIDVVDAVKHAEAGDPDAFDAWIEAAGEPALQAYAARMKAQKTITDFLDRLDTNNRIRTTYQSIVDTGRTSSRGSGGPGTLNVQQLPRDYGKPPHLLVRGCIVPDPGWALIVADYTQLELCALAHVLTQLVRFYARDPKKKAYAEARLGFPISTDYVSSLARAINNDQDCHVLMAATLRGNGESYEEVLALYDRAEAEKKAKRPLSPDLQAVIEDRQLAKPCNFGFPGGLGVRKFIDYAAGYNVSISLDVARRAKSAYMTAWPEMVLYFDHIGRLTAEGETTITQFYSKRERGGCRFTQACNGYFQALAADGAKLAGYLLVKYAYRVPESSLYGCRPSGFVHDEYIVNAPIEQAERALPEVERLMVEGMQTVIPGIKIKAPGKVLTERWGK